MRSEQQMLNLIMDKARSDERVRAVILGGSRANPNAPKDFFRDYDIIYVVTEMDSFISDHSWISIFGELMILQMPKCMKLVPDEDDGSFTYLMQFMDGNRIDLNLITVEKYNSLIERESQSILLLDKDGCIKPLPPASDSDYHITKPTEQLFRDCCNEFWWICPYVAKGIWRDELPYALFMHDRYERDMLIAMLGWYIGTKTDFSVSIGKHEKYMKKFLEPELWELYVKTHSDSNYENLWNALFTSCELFRTLAKAVANYFGYNYNISEDEAVSAHLKHVKALSRDATEMYSTP